MWRLYSTSPDWILAALEVCMFLGLSTYNFIYGFHPLLGSFPAVLSGAVLARGFSCGLPSFSHFHETAAFAVFIWCLLPCTALWFFSLELLTSCFPFTLIGCLLVQTSMWQSHPWLWQDPSAVTPPVTCLHPVRLALGVAPTDKNPCPKGRYAICPPWGVVFHQCSSLCWVM